MRHDMPKGEMTMDETVKLSSEQLPGKLLIVEDSKLMSSLLVNAARKELGVEPEVFTTYNDVANHLKAHGADYFAALLDLNLPDAPNGEVVDLVAGKGIPAIVFTGELSDTLRERMWSKRIVDYILKDNQDNVQQVVGIVKRLLRNRELTVLVADDSINSRRMLRRLLEIWQFTVLEAVDGQEALDILGAGRRVDLLITGYTMPNMDGITLTKKLRRQWSKSRLPIIGCSAGGGATASAYFIKAGANDYMHKPFLVEELYCRVIQCIENSEYIATIRELAERDFLTGLYNRRSFFQYGRKLFASQQRGSLGLALAMLDIDHFKRCNDTYGHDAGDEVIRAVARTLASRFRETDVVARIGGEEFCILCVNMEQDEAENIFDRLRQEIADTPIQAGTHTINVTMSVGLCMHTHDDLEAMMRCADAKLYEAKESGRNQVRVARG
jgi:diguanylate cyclase (GGDEF)-like protein